MVAIWVYARDSRRRCHLFSYVARRLSPPLAASRRLSHTCAQVPGTGMGMRVSVSSQDLRELQEDHTEAASKKYK